MEYHKIIKAAWGMTATDRGVVWYGTVPAFFLVLAGTVYMTWQYFAFRMSPFFGGAKFYWMQDLATNGAHYVTAHPGWVTVGLVCVGVCALGYLFLPAFCDAAIIGLVAAEQRGLGLSARAGISIGVRRSIRMLEFRALISMFGIMQFFTVMSYGLRYLGPSMFLWIFLGVLFFMSVVMHLMLLYSEQYIVLKGSDVTSSITGSAGLVFANLDHTFFIVFLMLMIGVRVVINVLLLLLIPVLVIGVTGLLIAKLSVAAGLAIGGVMGLVALLLSAHLIGHLHVFSVAVWTLTFENLISRHKEVDEVLGEDKKKDE